MKTVAFFIEIPEDIEVSEGELNDFLEFQLGIKVGISMTNPLVEYDISILNPSCLRMY